MPLNLTTVVDESTEVNAASVNQYKAAIETLAGAGWNDGAGDLDVEELSDEVKAARGSQASVDARLDTVLEETGALKASTVAKSNMVAGVLSGRGATADRPAASKSGFLYYNTQTGILERDNGASFADVTAVLTPAQRTDLTDGGDCTSHTHSGIAPGAHASTHADGGSDELDVADLADVTGMLLTPVQRTGLTGGGVTDLHSHPRHEMIYCDSSQSASAGNDAAALPTYVRDNTTTDEMVCVRAAFWKRSDTEQITLRCRAGNTAGVGTDGKLKIACGGLSAEATVAAAGTGDYELELAIGSLADDATYEIDVILYWTSASSGAQLELTRVTLWAEPGVSPT